MTVKVSPKFQVVIPEEIRTALNIKAGSKMNVVAKGKVIYLVPVMNLEDLQKDLSSQLDQKLLRDKKDRKI